MKRIILIVLTAFATMLTVNAQETKAKDNSPVLDHADVLPEYPGGTIKFMEYLRNNVKYPDEALKRKEQGRVIIQFVVNKDGSISDVSVEKGVTKLLDEAAIKVIKNMPRWKPGQHKGKPVRVKFRVPVQFRTK